MYWQRRVLKEGWKEASRGIVFFQVIKDGLCGEPWRKPKSGEAESAMQWPVLSRGQILRFARRCRKVYIWEGAMEKENSRLVSSGCVDSFPVLGLWLLDWANWLRDWGQVRESETLSRLQCSMSSQGAGQTRISETVSWLWGQRVLENWNWKWKMEVCSELHSSDKTLLATVEMSNS